MPRLLERAGDGWRDGPAQQVDARPPADWQAGQPLRLAPDDEVEAAHADAALILIEFPAFNDGRGLSQAVLLRTRFGYRGDLRAVGDVHQDILHYMLRCGFTSFELPDGRDPAAALACLEPYSDHYQASVTEPRPAFRRIARG